SIAGPAKSTNGASARAVAAISAADRRQATALRIHPRHSTANPQLRRLRHARADGEAARSVHAWPYTTLTYIDNACARRCAAARWWGRVASGAGVRDGLLARRGGKTGGSRRRDRSQRWCSDEQEESSGNAQ